MQVYAACVNWGCAAVSNHEVADISILMRVRDYRKIPFDRKHPSARGTRPLHGQYSRGLAGAISNDVIRESG